MRGLERRRREARDGALDGRIIAWDTSKPIASEGGERTWTARTSGA